MSQMTSETVHSASVVESTAGSVEALYFTLDGIPNLPDPFPELLTQIQAMRTVLMSVPTGRKTQYAGKSDKCSTPTLAALEEQHDESIASFESDGSSRC
jgi:hypothetical protein